MDVLIAFLGILGFDSRQRLGRCFRVNRERMELNG
jgi:hypothetical protein